MSTFSGASLAKLAASGLDETFAREMGVRPVSVNTELPVEFVEMGVRPAPGMLVPWRDPSDPERVTWQYRPDEVEDGAAKYLFATGHHQPLGLVRPAAGEPTLAVIIEGSFQGLAAARYFDENALVLAIPGCTGWSSDRNATSAMSIVAGLKVVIFLDADAGENATVYDAGVELARWSMSYGARDAAFSWVPGHGTNGFDDVMGSIRDDGERRAMAARLLEQVERKPAPRKPPGKAKAKSVYGVATAEGLPDINDMAVGTTWADDHATRFRYLLDDDQWLECVTGRWKRVSSARVGFSIVERLNKVAQQYLRAAGKYDGDRAEKLEETARTLMASAKLSSVRTMAGNYGPSHVSREQLDRHPTLWCAANCVIDLVTGEIHDHHPDMLLTTGSDVEYLPGAPCARFDEFLAEILPDAEVRAYVLRIFALAMFGAVREHVLATMIGEGRNGKGTLIRIMHAVFGSHAEVIEASALLMRKYEKHEQEVARLAGKRLVTCEETGRDAQWNVPRINSWTGGDALTGRWMGGNSFTFKPSHTLVMATNHRPNVGQGERAFWARYREIPFDVSFEGREDHTLEPWIIENELPGVLNRLLEAAAQYRAHGLAEPGAVTMATLDAKVDADNLARYCAEHIAVTGDHELDRIVNADLYDSVIKWWSQNVRGEVAPAARMFPKVMRQALGFTADASNPRKLGQGPDSKRTWTGIRWLNGGSPELRIEPLPQQTELIMDLRQRQSAAAQPSSNGVTIDQGDPNSMLPQTAGGTADDTADDVDHESEISAAPGSSTALTANTASKVITLGGESEKKEGVSVDHGYADTVQDSGERECAVRQCGSARGLVVLDLETADADQLHDHPEPREFVRLTGYTTGGETITEPSTDRLVESVRSSRLVVGSNLIHFDLPALSRIDPSVDLLELTAGRRVFDTMVADSVLNPIQNDLRPNAVGRAMKHFGLDLSCERHGIRGKTDDAKALAKEHGGFDRIPLDVLDPYIRGDVAATRALAGTLTRQMNAAPGRLREYLWREHQVHAVAATMGAQGFTVDTELLQRRFWQTAGRKADLTRSLIARYGIPTTKADGKPADSPASTKGGKEALLRAFHSLGGDVLIRMIPRTKPSEAHPQGQVSFGGDQMRELAEQCATHPRAEEIAALCETIADLSGIRTIYGTALENLHRDGKVHPSVATFQSSGRWSTTRPGLTVFGKRGGKVIERAIFTASDPHPKTGTTLFAIDLSQIDSRAIAVHSQDHAYLDLFGIGPDGKPLDAHEIVARMVWGDAAYDSNGDHLRNQVKAITHGLPYGMGIDKLVSHAKVERDVAERVVDTMNTRFPRLQQWKDEVREEAGAGIWLDNGFGRLMRSDPERAFTQGPALMGQGTARDLMMQALLNCSPEIQRMLRAQVHDEAIFEVPVADAVEIRAKVEDAFCFDWAPRSGMRPVSVVAEGGPFGFRWSDCYKKAKK